MNKLIFSLGVNFRYFTLTIVYKFKVNCNNNNNKSEICWDHRRTIALLERILKLYHTGDGSVLFSLIHICNFQKLMSVLEPWEHTLASWNFSRFNACEFFTPEISTMLTQVGNISLLLPMASLMSLVYEWWLYIYIWIADQNKWHCDSVPSTSTLTSAHSRNIIMKWCFNLVDDAQNLN